MTRFLTGRASRAGRLHRPKKCHIRPVLAGTDEGRQVEKDYEMPSNGFCEECESFVDEAHGKLHRPTCKVTPERKRAS